MLAFAGNVADLCWADKYGLSVDLVDSLQFFRISFQLFRLILFPHTFCPNRARVYSRKQQSVKFYSCVIAKLTLEKPAKTISVKFTNSENKQNSFVSFFLL